MRVVLDLAISADGFIAKPDGDSDWVADSTEALFKQRVRELGALVVGRRTFEQYYKKIYPVEGALNLVLGHSQTAVTDHGVQYVSSIEEALSTAIEKGCSGLLIAGGASVSKAFLEAGLIDEVYFSVHPLKLGEGMKPFADAKEPDLKLVDSADLGDGLVQKHYLVMK